MQHSPGFVKLVDETKQQIKELSWPELFSEQKNKSDLLIIDVREQSEWDQGHVDKAIHLSKGIIERDIEKTVPNKATPLALYCGGGSRSALAALNLNKMGYSEVYSIKGGYRGFVELQQHHKV